MSDNVTPPSQLVLRGRAIREDANGHICLDDLWELARAPISRAPKHWRGNGAAKRLIAELRKKVTSGYLKSNKPMIDVIYAGVGRGNAGTYGHPLLAVAYAGYLNPKLEIEVLQVWLRYRKGDADLADEILQRASAEDNERVGIRALARAERLKYTDILREHGVVEGGYAQCTNAIYKALLGGSAAQIRHERGWPARTNLRDRLPKDELAFVMASEVLAGSRIVDEGRHGNDDCAIATSRSAGFIREAVERDKMDRQKRFIG